MATCKCGNTVLFDGYGKFVNESGIEYYEWDELLAPPQAETPFTIPIMDRIHATLCYCTCGELINLDIANVVCTPGPHFAGVDWEDPANTYTEEE